MHESVARIISCVFRAQSIPSQTATLVRLIERGPIPRSLFYWRYYSIALSVMKGAAIHILSKFPIKMQFILLAALIFQVVTVEGNFLKSMFAGVKGSSMKSATLKTQILTLARQTRRGLIETNEEKEAMLNLFEQLEKENKYKDSLSSPLINAIWNLEYTTSDSILGRGGSERVGPIFQTIDGPNLYAKNTETVNYFGLFKVPRSVTAALTPMSGSKVAVQFKKFTLGPIGFNAPEAFKGELDITYIDEDLRLSRGDKGNIFVLTKYSDLPGSSVSI